MKEIYYIVDHDICIYSQSLEEPGRDTSKFDTIMPTVVRPATKDTFMPDEDLGDVSSFIYY